MPTRLPFAALLILFTFSFTFSAAAQSLTVPAGSVTGHVTTVSGNLITVLNGAVTIDATGASFHARGRVASVADVRPGVQIMASIRNPLAPPGTLLQAANILILEPPAGALSGPVQSVDVAGSALTIFGARVVITPTTRFVSVRPGGNATLADVKAGDTVVIELGVTGSTLVAETIHILPPVPNATLEGTVKSMGASSWVITTRNGDVAVTVNEQTRIDPGVQVGDRAIIVGTADAAGHITAIAITRSVTTPVMPTVDTIEGTVKSIGASSWVITTGEAKDVTVGIDRITRIDPTIVLGDSVVVLTRRDSSGNLVAVAIMKSSTRRRSAAH